MKRIITGVIILAMAMATLTGCNNIDTKEKSRKITNETTPVVVDNPVVFVKVDQDLENDSCTVTPITADGKSHAVTMAAADCTLKEVCSEEMSEGVLIYNVGEMEELLTLNSRIVTYDCDVYNNTYNTQITSLYAVSYDESGNPYFTLLGTYGATVSIPQDPNAYELCNCMGIEWL